MTIEEAKEVMRELALKGRIAHLMKDYKKRNELFDLHDTLALAVWHGYEIPTLPYKSSHGCMLRKAFAA